MAEIDPLDGPLKFSLRRLSVEFDLNRSTVSERLKGAAVEPSGMRSGHPVYLLKDAIRACFSFAGQPGQPGFDPEKLPPGDRRHYYASELDRLKVEQQAGRLIPDTDVEREMINLVAPLIQMLETLPDVLERDCDLSPEQVERVIAACDAERARVADIMEHDVRQ